MTEQAIEINAAVAKDRRRRSSPAADIVAGLRADGLLPFSPRLTLTEALALARFLRDYHAAWGTSGALTPPDLDRTHGTSGRGGQPGVPSAAGIRVTATLHRLRDHERHILEWIEKSRGRTNVTLVKAGLELAPGSTKNENKAASVALGLIKGFCRTLIEVHPVLPCRVD